LFTISQTIFQNNLEEKLRESEEMNVRWNKSTNYGLAYLISIFIFAAVYTNMQAGFIQSTSRFDPYYIETEQNIKSLLSNHLELSIFAVEGNGDIKFTFQHDTVSNKAVNPKAQQTSNFLCNIEIPHTPLWEELSGRHPEEYGINFELKVKGSFYCASSLVNALLPIDEVPELSKLNGDDNILDSLGLGQPEFYKIGINPTELTRLVARLNSRPDGVILRSWTNYFRFVYFSSVTATTLGYGDMVPIRDTSRNIVTIQVLFSVVCIGLFLNGLSARAHKETTN